MVVCKTGSRENETRDSEGKHLIPQVRDSRPCFDHQETIHISFYSRIKLRIEHLDQMLRSMKASAHVQLILFGLTQMRQDKWDTNLKYALK